MVVCALVGVFFLLHRNNLSAFSPEQRETGVQEEIVVSVVSPRYGAFERVTVLPGSVESYQSALVYAQVSGVLKEQKVDYGDEVHKGDVLAVLDVPDLDKEVKRRTAALKQAQAKVVQMQARVRTAQADLEAKTADVIKAQSASRSAAAWTRFRTKQVNRWAQLSTRGNISEQVVDESREKLEAAKETQLAAEAAVPAALAHQKAAAALVEQATADVTEAQSEVDVARAELEKAQVMLDFATIRAPFDGVISQRYLFPGDFVRAATEGGTRPLFSMETTDQFRVVAQIPDRDVPYADPGDTAYVEIDAFPGQRFPATISRIARSEDPQTRLMHVELDLKNNARHQIVHGMYGRVTIVLDKAAHSLSLPSACLRDKSRDSTGHVYVVERGRARERKVHWGADDGIHVEIIDGLKADDQVIVQPPPDLVSDTPVAVVPEHEPQVPASDAQERELRK